ncbi:MAG: formate dehydrogenase accessory protein FdhE [Raoultibacter sp.]
MNLKHLDAACAAYQKSIDVNDAERLAFFREIWEVQARNASLAAAARSYEVPATERLQHLYRQGISVFSQFPVLQDEACFSATATQLCDVITSRGTFDPAVSEVLRGIDWPRFAAETPLELGGLDPAAYLQTAADILCDEGVCDAALQAVLAVVALALRAMLDVPAAAVSAALDDEWLTETAPVRCPVCGGEATAARVGEGEKSRGHGRGKTLWCAQCGTSWGIERIRCGRCGMQNQSNLHYFNVEGDEAHRLAICDACGRYLRTCYSDDALAPFAFEVEDVLMANLDAIACDPRFQQNTFTAAQ